MFKKAIELGANFVKNYKAACEDHELTGRNHWEYFLVPLVVLGIIFAVVNFITDPMRKQNDLKRR